MARPGTYVSTLPSHALTQKDGGHPRLRKLRRLWEEGVLADNEQLKEGIRAHIKDVTFQVCWRGAALRPSSLRGRVRVLALK